MAKILVAFDTLDEGFERLQKEHRLIRPPKGRDFTQEELETHIIDADVLCSVFDIPVEATLLAQAKKLKLVANYAVGYNNIDITYCKEHNIAVTNTPRSVVAPTAELAMALMLSCARRIRELDECLRKSLGQANLGRLGMLSYDLYGKTIGIVGYGNIGAAVAERSRAFGMKVLYYKRNRLSEELERNRHLTYASLDELLRRSDIVSLHTPYSTLSHHQIDARALSLMKPTAMLINTARGAIVDELALVSALCSGQIAMAGLDVFENRDIPHPDLLSLPQVVLTPHVGTQTYDARVAMTHEMIDNILAFLSGQGELSRIV